ncbi:dihydrofolate reductase [Candidatus Kaiserbacteria bacterium]|nr:dihydrofolate reductase [Candidatus Kaiserbacteria bacterium]
MENKYIIIAAIGKNSELGRGGKLLWHIPDDMRRFKALTTGHPVIMGRKTWESLPKKFRPLPGRTNIVVTRQKNYKAEGAMIINSFEAARAAAARVDGADEVFIIGGGELYREALPYADRLYLTLVNDTAEADIFSPLYEPEFKIILDEADAGEPPHRFLTLERK